MGPARLQLPRGTGAGSVQRPRIRSRPPGCGGSGRSRARQDPWKRSPSPALPWAGRVTTARCSAGNLGVRTAAHTRARGRERFRSIAPSPARGVTILGVGIVGDRPRAPTSVRERFPDRRHGSGAGARPSVSARARCPPAAGPAGPASASSARPERRNRPRSGRPRPAAALEWPTAPAAAGFALPSPPDQVLPSARSGGRCVGEPAAGPSRSACPHPRHAPPMRCHP